MGWVLSEESGLHCELRPLTWSDRIFLNQRLGANICRRLVKKLINCHRSVRNSC